MTPDVQGRPDPTAGGPGPEEAVVVGVDGSEASDAALDWALREGALRDLPVTVLQAEDPLSLSSFTLPGVVLPAVLPPEAEGRLAGVAEQALGRARARTGLSTPARAVGVVAPPRQVLLEAADTAPLVVVGRRGAGRLRHLVLGSVASAVVHHARGPVAVVPERWSQDGRGRVVVGYDGSAPARAAVRAAADEARRRGAVLEVVLAWQVVTTLPALMPASGYVPPLADCQALAERVLGEARAELTDPADPGSPAPEVVTRAVHASPAAALLDAAAEADLVVVGARGTGGFAQALLGSVSTAVTRHAACPVVVVRGTGAERPEPAARQRPAARDDEHGGRGEERGRGGDDGRGAAGGRAAAPGPREASDGRVASERAPGRG